MWRTRPQNLLFTMLSLLVPLCAGVYAHLEGEIDINHQLVIAFSFVFLGMLIKYGDQAFDTGAFNRRSATLLAVLGGL